MTRSLPWLLTVLFFIAVGATAHAQPSECDAADPNWLFCEDFEQGGLGWDAWFAQSPFVECNGCPGGTNDPARILLENSAANAYAGNWSLYMPADASASYRGASLTYRSCQGTKQGGCTPLIGYDQLYYRAWLRLDADHSYVHHFMSIAGTQPNNYWDSDGNAGCRPNGYRAAGTTVDFNGSHELFFYTYTPDMGCDDIFVGSGYCGNRQPGICDDCAAKQMPCASGPECCWGNLYSATPRPVLPVGQWVCLEMMMQLNTPTQADGEMTFWIDDQLGHRETGMYWRDIAELQLNKVWVQHYIATGDASQSNRIRWDNVIVSTARIGCGSGPPPADGATTADGGPVAGDSAVAVGDPASGGDSVIATGDSQSLTGDNQSATGDGQFQTGSGGTGTGSGGAAGGPKRVPVIAACDCAGAYPVVWLGVAAVVGLRRRRRLRSGATSSSSVC